jgi:hypothetical protein
VDVETLAAVVTVAVAVSSGLSGLLGHWIARRAASGRVNTSEASVLWQQSQDMRAMLLAEKAKAEEQRDRLIDAYTEQVFPVLSDINTAVVDIADTLAEVASSARIIRASVGGGGYEEAAGLPAAGTRQDGG